MISKEKNKTSRLPIDIIKYPSVFSVIFSIFTLLFVFNQSVSKADEKFVTNTLQKQNLFQSPSKSYITNYLNNLPTDAAPKPKDEKSSDENELTESAVDIDGFLGCIFAFHDSKIATGVNFFLYQLHQTLQNRCAVALFVLHHSWKSFLN